LSVLSIFVLGSAATDYFDELAATLVRAHFGVFRHIGGYDRFVFKKNMEGECLFSDYFGSGWSFREHLYAQYGSNITELEEFLGNKGLEQ